MLTKLSGTALNSEAGPKGAGREARNNEAKESYGNRHAASRLAKTV